MAKTDDKTLKLIAEVKRRKEEIADAEKPNYVTNMTFTLGEGGKPVNLHVEKSVARLVSVAGFLIRQKMDYEEAAKKMSIVDVPDFQWEGFSLDSWLSDLKTRINKAQLTSKKQQLATLEARLDKVVSPELRAEMELEQIEKELDKK